MAKLKILEWVDSIFPKQKIKGKSEQTVIVNKVKVQPVVRRSQDIQSWRTAITSAESRSQNRLNLFDLYTDIMLDAHLLSVLKKRTDQVTNRKLIFVREDGEQVEELNRLSRRSFFKDFRVEALNAKFYGHSLIELYWPAMGDVEGKTILIPRAHVKPRFGIVCEHTYDLEGYDYRKPPFAQNVIEVGGPEDLGLLASLAQYVIYKRGNFGDWAEYAEIFGIPFRWATYNNEQSRVVLEEALAKAGSAGYVVAPSDAHLEFMNGNNTGQGQEVFRTLRDACNEEMSIGALGQTMTTKDTKSGGYAQGSIHQMSQDELIAADRDDELILLNEKLNAYLARLGYPVENGEWKYEEEDRLSPAQRIDIDLKVASQVPIPDRHWYEKYGLPKPTPEELAELQAREASKAAQQPIENPEDADDEGDDDTPKNDPPGKLNARSESPGANRLDRIAQFYVKECSHASTLNLSDPNTPRFRRISQSLERKVANAVRAGKLNENSLSDDLYKNYYSRMRRSVRAGFGRSLGEHLDWNDFELLQGIKRNISAFAAAKQQALIAELQQLIGRPKADYDLAASAIMKRYHDRYFRVELDTMEAAAQMAGQWPEFLERADLYPNLKFSTVGDDRVRPDHAALDGAIYPVNDPFWATHTPPLDWRCRCILIQTDEAVDQRAVPDIRAGFGLNPYTSRKLINDDHPYFDLPGDQLDRLFQAAEIIRAAMERTEVTAAARVSADAAPILPGLGEVSLSNAAIDSIIESESRDRALRNALLTALEDVISRMRPTDEETVYNIQVLGISFRTYFRQIEDAWEITELRAL